MEPCVKAEHFCLENSNSVRNECPEEYVRLNCRRKGYRKEERLLMYCPHGLDDCVDYNPEECEKCCGTDECGPGMPKCSEAFPETNHKSKVLMKVKIQSTNKTLNDPKQKGAHVKVSFGSGRCTTGRLPAMGAPASGAREWIILDTAETLGTCRDLDVREDTEITDKNNAALVSLKVKLPLNSLISVSSVKLIDAEDHQRCWKAKWKGGKWNQQTNEYVEGNSIDFDRMC